MFMILSLTFNIFQGQMPIERPHTTFRIGINNICSICHHLRDIQIWTSQCTQFESLTLKMRSRTFDDFDQNYRTNLHFLTCMRAVIGASSYGRIYVNAYMMPQNTEHPTNGVKRSPESNRPTCLTDMCVLFCQREATKKMRALSLYKYVQPDTPWYIGYDYRLRLCFLNRAIVNG